MLAITVPAVDYYDESSQTFLEKKSVTLRLEHSLFSISKWESIWETPFLVDKEKTRGQTLSYIYCMSLDEVDPEVFNRLTTENLKSINEYINSKRTATWFSQAPGSATPKRSQEVITSELIYYYMVAFQIPFECQYWHIERLFTLIKICNEKQTPPKKMSRREILARNRQLNAQRKSQLNTRG